MRKRDGVQCRSDGVRLFLFLTAVVTGVGLVALPCSASPVVNEGFDAGLAGWMTAGDVLAGPEATLGDNQVTYSLLYQGVNLAPGLYVLEFDLLNVLSPDVPIDPFAFFDTFFASLYYIDDLSAFDLAGSVFDDVDAILDMDSSGPFNVSGNIGPSVLGGDWLHVSFGFTSTYAYAIPVFELFDLNTINGDSQVRVDNVTISPRGAGIIPEPATTVLTAIGLLGFALRRARACH